MSRARSQHRCRDTDPEPRATLGATANDARVGVRPMRPEDATEVAEIEREAFAVPWRESTFRRLIDDRRTRAWTAAAEDGRVVGYAVMWFRDEGAQLGNLAVAEEWRRRGLGRLLVRRALEAVRGSESGGRLVLEVRESNEAAMRLYRGLGFRVLGRRPDYYRSPREDALVMAVEAG